MLQATCLAEVDRTLDAFVAAQIAIPMTARSSASTSQIRLRSILANKANYDSSFPHLLSSCDSDFIGGSFARHTKIWPLDDIDLYIPLDGAHLFYMRNGAALPFKVLSDDSTRSQRLLTDKWMRGDYLASDLVVKGFAAALKGSYPNSSVTKDDSAVTLQTGVAATNESSGIGFDVVPCFCLAPEDGGEHFYLMPKGGGWIRTNPRLDTRICADLHDYHNETFRKVVRLVKYWNVNAFSDHFSSYFIELAICKCFEERRELGKPFTYIVGALPWAFYSVRSAFKAGKLASFVEEAPPVLAPQLDSVDVQLLNNACELSNNALKEANAENRDGSVRYLTTLFGADFEG